MIIAPRQALIGLIMLSSAGSLYAANAAPASAPRVLSRTLPDDHRLGPLKDLNGYFPFRPCSTPATWSLRARNVRQQLAVALGLWPMPEKTRLNAVIHGKIERDDYTVEKVCFESLPGFFVTGNLYRPKGLGGRLPTVLCPHGHWKNGRFLETPDSDIKRELASGAELFENAARSPLQARCVHLARLGCIVFHYDMIGYADSQQISEALAHQFAKQRPDMSTADGWGLFSPQAEAHLQSIMGLQTWNSIRALDFVTNLPDVDKSRVAVTGASGGGTQTFILCALDDRPAAAFPAVMVSTAMQGGCTCENACLLRVGTGNVELAALFAPRPLGMTAANDWTKEMQTKGFSELRQHFTMLGAPQNVSLTPLLQFGHNYNAPSRAAMYAWFNKYLKLGPTDLAERNFEFLPPAQLSVWDEQHPKPPGGPEFERNLLRHITERDQRLLAQHQNSLSSFKNVYGGAWDAILGRRFSEVGPLTSASYTETDRGSHVEKLFIVRNLAHNEEIPTLVLAPKNWNGRAVLWADPKGKIGLYTQNADDLNLRNGVRRLLDAGVMVIAADLFLQGEFLNEGQEVTTGCKVGNPRESAAYTFGYNHTLFAQRVHDLLTVIKYAQTYIPGLRQIDLAGLNRAGHWVAAARAQAGDAVHSTVIDTAAFRFANVNGIYDVNFVPGGAKYGDLPGILALGAPHPLWLAGEPESPALTRRIYRFAKAERNLVHSQAAAADTESAAVYWLLRR